MQFLTYTDFSALVWFHQLFIDIWFAFWATPVFHPLLFQVIRRGDRRPFYAPARYVMEVKTDQARLQVGKIGSACVDLVKECTKCKSLTFH